LFSLKKRRLQGHLVETFQYLNVACKKEGERHFTRVCSDRARANGFKLKGGRFTLDMRKKFFIMSAVRHWNRLPGGDVDVPSLEVFKLRLNRASSNLI